jgi:hypothetical protein
MPRGVLFWTAYRKHYVRELLARDESVNLIAERLGVTRKQVIAAMRRYGLAPRPLLERIQELGGDPGHMRGRERLTHG